MATSLSAQTRKSYKRLMNEMQRELNDGKETIEFAKDTEKVVKWIEELPKAFSTKKLYYAMLKSHLRDYGGEEYKEAEKVYGDTMYKYNTKLSEVAENQEMTKREAALWIEWPDVVKLREKLIDNITDMSSFQDALIISLYSHLPPARADYAPMRVVTNEPTDTSGNYLLVPPGTQRATFIFNEYKTAKTLGQRRIAAPPPLSALIRGWLRLNDSGWFLLGENGRPMNEDLLGKRIKKIFTRETGRGTGINILRHSYITEARRGEKPLKEQKKLADAMGHSIGMSQLYRRV